MNNKTQDKRNLFHDDYSGRDRLCKKLDLMSFQDLRAVLTSFLASVSKEYPDSAKLHALIFEVEQIIKKTQSHDRKWEVHYANHSLVHHVSGTKLYDLLAEATA